MNSEARDSFRAVIQMYHVTKRYPNGIEALRDVTVRVHEGEFVFLSGPSGAGKSTFINTILGEERNIGTDIAGTTRDSVHTRYQMFGFDFEIFTLNARYT